MMKSKEVSGSNFVADGTFLFAGMIMCKPGTVKSEDHLETQVYILTKEEGGRTRPFTNYIQVVMFSRTWDSPVQVILPEKDMVMPGEDAKYASPSPTLSLH